MSSLALLQFSPFQIHQISANLRIGRNPACSDVIVQVPSISGLHCTISSILVLEDNGSTNGVFVNGKRINRSIQLKIGDEITLATRHFEESHLTSFVIVSFPCKLYCGDRFIIMMEKVLGSGSYANVCLAYDLVGRVKRCAVKVIDRKRLAPLQSKRQQHQLLLNLRNEVNLLESLDHLNIVKILDKSYLGGHGDDFNFDTLLIFQELVDGGELFDHLQRQGTLSEIEAKCYIYQILQGLKYLHDRGIAHRDIKPENILLETGQFSRILLVDFGLSANLSNRKQGQMMNTFCGTANYLAPEVLEDRGDGARGRGYDKKVDCWAVGIVTYALLSGTLPFYEEDEKETLCQIKNTREIDLSSDPLWSNYSPRALDFIKALLVWDPAERLSVSEALCHNWFQDNKAQVYYEILRQNLNPKTLLSSSHY